jgi:hypothetical protein
MRSNEAAMVHAVTSGGNWVSEGASYHERRIVLTLGRVFSGCDKQTSQVNDARAIQEERRYRRSTGWREADQQGEIVAPGEMLLPAITARMVERCLLLESGSSAVALSYLWLLQPWQASAKLSGVEVPPRTRARMCSTANESIE